MRAEGVLSRLLVSVALASTAALAGAGCSDGGADTAPGAAEILHSRRDRSTISPMVMPAEWEPHDAVWLSWPTYDSVQDQPKEPVFRAIIKALASHVDVNLMVQTEADQEAVENDLADHGIPYSHVHFWVVPYQDIWLRDMGPIFVKNDSGEAAVVDFDFNSWGYAEYSSAGVWDTEEFVDREVATAKGLPIIESPIISEGGAVELNGKGTMIMAESVAFQRNPTLTRAQIEQQYRDTLGVQKIIWVEKGVPEDDLSFDGVLPGNVFTALTVGGHTDEFVRFVNDRTILLAEVTPWEASRDPISALARQRLESAYAILQASTDQDGNPFTIVRVPAVPPIYKMMGPGDDTYEYLTTLTFRDGTVIPPGASVKVVAPASYLNFVVTNGVVLMQKFWKAGRPTSLRDKDRQMKRVLERYFPGRTVVEIDAEAVQWGGGGIHCITQQQPAGVAAAALAP